MGGVFSLIGTVLNWILYLALAAAFHYLWAAPLYRIAKKRGMQAAWLGWVPVISMFALFAIADDILRRRRHRAPLLLCGLTAACVWSILAFVLFLLPYEARTALSGALDNMLVLLWLAAALVLYVTVYVALYKLYTEYKHRNAVTFTVLGILTPIAVPIFLFSCRGERPRSGW